MQSYESKAGAEQEVLDETIKLIKRKRLRSFLNDTSEIIALRRQEHDARQKRDLYLQFVKELKAALN